MIYFDSAATTFQKPRTVADAMRDAMATMSSPGRGGYPAAMRAAEAAFDCRTELAELYHLENPEQVAFTMNATHGLNIAIKSLVPPGGKAVISGYEHNAVTRPLAALGAQVSVAAAPLFQPAAVTAAFDRLIVPGTDAVICNHVSNVFGFVQPVEAIAAICREREVPFIIDASQSAGMLTLDMTALGAAFIAMPGHKGLYGPQGTGVLLCGKDVPVRTLLEGGTGSISIQQEMPDFLPDRLEAGTHNMPGIAGLLAGVRFVRQLGPEAICAGERQLTFQAAEGLRRLPGLQVFALPDLGAQAGVLSIVPERMDAEALGAALADRGIAVRAGLHCAPLAQEMPDFLPDRLEAGTHNMPGIAGLLAGVRFVRQLGPEAICAGERQLTFQAAEGLRRLPGLQVFALPDLGAQAGVLSIVPERMDAEALGAALADRGIAVRAGLHCAPLAHRTAGTLDTGTVRLSFSHWNTREEVSRFLGAMGEILR